MKQPHVFALLLVTLLFWCPTSVFAAAESILIDEETATIPAEMGSIKETDDRTFVPIRFVMEYLGCHVNFDDQNHIASIASDACVYLIQEDNPELFLVPLDSADSSVILMDTVPFIDEAESRMYIPIRFLAEAIGYDIGWDEATQIVTLTSK